MSNIFTAASNKQTNTACYNRSRYFSSHEFVRGYTRYLNYAQRNMQLSDMKRTENCFQSTLFKKDICADICLRWAIYVLCKLQTKSYSMC